VTAATVGFQKTAAAPVDRCGSTRNRGGGHASLIRAQPSSLEPNPTYVQEGRGFRTDGRGGEGGGGQAGAVSLDLDQQPVGAHLGAVQGRAHGAADGAPTPGRIDPGSESRNRVPL